MPNYIPSDADEDDGNANLLTPEQANVSGEGTSKNTLKTDFNALAGYLSAVIGGPSSNVVTVNGKNTFGKQYFYNTGSKCTIDSSNNLNYCDTKAKVGDSVYEYIYINTLSNGLMPGIMHDVVDMAKVPLKVTDVLVGDIFGAKCRCVPLNVTTGGVTRCAAAYVNTKNLSDSNVVSNKCNNPVIDSMFPGGGGFLDRGDTGNTGDSGDKSIFDKLPGIRSGFTTMNSKIHKNIDGIFVLAFGILILIVLHKLIYK